MDAEVEIIYGEPPILPLDYMLYQNYRIRSIHQRVSGSKYLWIVKWWLKYMIYSEEKLKHYLMTRYKEVVILLNGMD